LATASRRIIASGWHTAAMVMKLTAEARPLGGVTVLGLGVEEMQWPQPVRPGDTVRVRVDVAPAHPEKVKSNALESSGRSPR
jgi:acyl dehydratase